MRKLMLLLLVADAAIAYAQNISDSTVHLDEVTVTGRSIIQKVDRMLIVPTKAAKRNAYNAYDLMFNMAIPRLQVNAITKDVSANGGAVQLRINGIKATQAEVAALLPKEIVRIELIENPGKRYGDEELGAVVDMIVRKREDGGLLNLQTMNSPHVPFGENNLTAKYNHGKTQWGLNYSFNYRDVKKSRTDKTEDFFLENQNIHRVQQGVNDQRNWYEQNIDISYNLSVPDKYTFNAVWRNNVKNAPHQDETSIINNMLTARQLTKSNAYSPAVELYYQRILPRQQTLTFSLTGTLIATGMTRAYSEQMETGTLLADYLTDVDEHKQSIIGEAIYDRRFKAIALSAGFRHYQMHDRSEYAGTHPVSSQMNQMRSSAFAEMQGAWHKINYTLSTGITRSYFKDGEMSHCYYSFTPTLRLAFSPHKDGYISCRFSADPQIPSLSALTDVEQAIDTIQLMRGNPNLHTYNVYHQSLSYSYQKNKLLMMLNANYDYHDNCIMESIMAEGDKLIMMQDNQRSYQTLQISPVVVWRGLNVLGMKDFLTLSLEGGFARYWSHGNTYNHTYSNFYYNLQFNMNYKEFGLMGQFSKNRNTLLGETIYKGENQTAILGVWTHKRLQIGVGMLFPFTNNYRTGQERISSVAPYTSWNYVKETGRLAVIRINYHFEIGRRYHETQKRINNSDNESGILNTQK
jgi:hypothetical protein